MNTTTWITSIFGAATIAAAAAITSASAAQTKVDPTFHVRIAGQGSVPVMVQGAKSRATAMAIEDWRRHVDARYGSAFDTWGLARGKTVDCGGSGVDMIMCKVTAIPEKG